ncbi:tripartite tricarboxylate transporter TctB family protein [Martelella mediterranea]|uniref:Tripartite tricarboxylate transporter TctB family protein n=1 Tax=Martelella mediterranea DSM 17316 TaxID=1122214 RepID=A0A1U9Z028_9HYPH|nr:tripartite tricarboxylate transporter TctB family protein [Martelella mediterranea]AQZ51056.1 Tripartite tricarboxylate transporter TctB family protein [Martelella mediterranea DSM 17316]
MREPQEYSRLRDVSWWFGIALSVLAAVALVSALNWETMAASFPIFNCVIMLACGIAHTLLPQSAGSSPMMEGEKLPLGLTLRYAAWIGAFFAGAIVFGFPVATPVFVLSYMLAHGERWTTALIASAGTLVFLLVVVDRVLRLPLAEPWFLFT